MSSRVQGVVIAPPYQPGHVSIITMIDVAEENHAAVFARSDLDEADLPTEPGAYITPNICGESVQISMIEVIRGRKPYIRDLPDTNPGNGWSNKFKWFFQVR